MLGCDKCCEERQEQEVGLYSWRVGGVGVGVSSFREWVRDGLIGKVTFEQRPKRGEGMSCGAWNSRQKAQPGQRS